MAMKKGGYGPEGHGVSEREGKRVGSGDFAGMPQNVNMKAYPKSAKYRGRDLDDTIEGIDSCNHRSEAKAMRHLSNQH